MILQHLIQIIHNQQQIRRIQLNILFLQHLLKLLRRSNIHQIQVIDPRIEEFLPTIKEISYLIHEPRLAHPRPPVQIQYLILFEVLHYLVHFSLAPCEELCGFGDVCGASYVAHVAEVAVFERGLFEFLCAVEFLVVAVFLFLREEERAFAYDFVGEVFDFHLVVGLFDLFDHFVSASLEGFVDGVSEDVLVEF